MKTYTGMIGVADEEWITIVYDGEENGYDWLVDKIEEDLRNGDLEIIS